MWIVAIVAALAGVPVEEVRWDIAVRGPVAEAIVTQRFDGPSRPGLRANYTFALPHQGVVDNMTMVIGDTTIRSALRESRQARQEYEVAARSGQIAGLTSQVAGGVFLQELANLPAGQSVEVQLRVLWPVTHVNGQYELVIPTDVAPRFTPAGGSSAPVSASTPYPVRIDADIEAGFDIAGMHSPTHTDVDITALGSHADVSWRATRPQGDLLIHWENAMGATQSAAITSGDHSLLVMQGPPPTATESGPVEWVIVLDTSSSMSGVSWRRAVGVVDSILDQVGDEDTVGLLTFGDSVHSLAPTAGTSGTERVRRQLEQTLPDGGTLLPTALSAATALPHDATKRRVMVVLTDGLVTDESSSLTALATAGQRADLAIVGVNASPNRALLDRLAVAANGASAYYLPGDTPQTLSGRLLTSIHNAKCTDVRVSWSTHVQAWPNQPGPLLAGQPVVMAAKHRDPPSWVEVSCHLNGQRWSSRVRPTAVDRGRGLQAAWARRNLEALLHEGWATGTDPRLKATALALEYGILSPWTSLVAVESRPNGDLLDAEVEAADIPSSVQPPLVDTTSTSRGQVVDREFLLSIPTGRSYQSAVEMTTGVVGGGVVGGVVGLNHNQNTYLFDGVNVADSGGNAIEVYDNPGLHFGRADFSIAPSVTPSAPQGTNALDIDIGGAWGTAGQREAHAIASGPVVRDRLWAVGRVYHQDWDAAEAQQGMLRLSTQPTAKSRVTVDADILRFESADLQLDRRELRGIWQWEPGAAVSVTSRADASRQRQGTTTRRSFVATSELRHDRQAYAVGSQIQLGRVGRKDVSTGWIGRAETFGRYEPSQNFIVDAAAGVAASGTLSPTGRIALRAQDPGGWLIGSLVAEQTVPDLTQHPADDLSLPRSRAVGASLRGELAMEIWAGAHAQFGQWDMWSTSGDVRRLTGSSTLLRSTGPSASLWLEKILAKRWHAKATWFISGRRAQDGALDTPNIADAQPFTDGLRAHRLRGTFMWGLPLDPWATTIELGGEWASRIEGVDERWAAPRLALEVRLQQDLDIRHGTLMVHAGLRHGVSSELGALTTALGPTLQYSGLSERLQDRTQLQLGMTWRL